VCACTPCGIVAAVPTFTPSWVLPCVVPGDGVSTPVAVEAKRSGMSKLVSMLGGKKRASTELPPPPESMVVHYFRASNRLLREAWLSDIQTVTLAKSSSGPAELGAWVWFVSTCGCGGGVGSGMCGAGGGSVGWWVRL
jgi:hypothetical protein